MYTYAEIVADYNGFNNRQPEAIYFGNDPVIAINSWRQANEMTTDYLCEHYDLPPLPYPKPDSYGASFISSTPTHPNGQPIKEYRTLHVQDTTIYVNRALTVFSIKRHVSRLFEAVGAPMDVVKVSVR